MDRQASGFNYLKDTTTTTTTTTTTSRLLEDHVDDVL